MCFKGVDVGDIIYSHGVSTENVFNGYLRDVNERKNVVKKI